MNKKERFVLVGIALATAYLAAAIMLWAHYGNPFNDQRMCLIHSEIVPCD